MHVYHFKPDSFKNHVLHRTDVKLQLRFFIDCCCAEEVRTKICSSTVYMAKESIHVESITCMVRTRAYTHPTTDTRWHTTSGHQLTCELGACQRTLVVGGVARFEKICKLFDRLTSS